MRIGVSIRIDVKKILKDRLYVGAKGTYLDLTTFIDLENKDQHGNSGFISQSVSKEEKAQGVQPPILGNTKVFWGLDQVQQPKNQNQGYQQPKNQQQIPDDEIPF